MYATMCCARTSCGHRGDHRESKLQETLEITDRPGYDESTAAGEIWAIVRYDDQAETVGVRVDGSTLEDLLLPRLQHRRHRGIQHASQRVTKFPVQRPVSERGVFIPC